MIRQALPTDAEAMDRFLAQHAETSMFLRGNLAGHGTQEKVHRHGTTFFLAEQGGALCAVGGVTNGGFVMCQGAEAPAEFYDAFAAALAGRSLLGMTGAPAEVTTVFDALGCQNADFSLRAVDPLFALQLDSMDPARFEKGHLRRPTQRDVDNLAVWFEGFRADAGLMPYGDGDGRETAQHFIASPDARMLMMEGEPVAMSTFNARAQDVVQIGGVYVPNALRGRGYGGGIVARHLLEVRAQGIQKAILFAASDHAARAYEAIGFKHIGSYELALLKEPWQVKS